MATKKTTTSQEDAVFESGLDEVMWCTVYALKNKRITVKRITCIILIVVAAAAFFFTHPCDRDEM